MSTHTRRSPIMERSGIVRDSRYRRKGDICETTIVTNPLVCLVYISVWHVLAYNVLFFYLQFGRSVVCFGFAVPGAQVKKLHTKKVGGVLDGIKYVILYDENT